MFLLDVNFLVALAWDDHDLHEAAHEWFTRRSTNGFSTCHVSQSGFLRVSLQTEQTTNITDAIEMLKSLTSQAGHRFWNDGPMEVDSPLWQEFPSGKAGGKAVTDLNLFLIARRNNGKLVTFDQGIPKIIPKSEHRWIEVLEA